MQIRTHYYSFNSTVLDSIDARQVFCS